MKSGTNSRLLVRRTPLTFTHSGVTWHRLTEVLVRRLGLQELRRRLWHMAPGLYPFIFCFIPHVAPESWIWKAVYLIHALILGASGVYLKRIVCRPHEKSCLSCAAAYAGVVLGTLLLFPHQPELGMTVLTIIAFGDGSATLVGLLVKGARLPWNARKTWWGTLAFVVFAAPLASMAYWGTAVAPIPFSTALVCGGTATLVAALAESLPMRFNDNFLVGLTSAITVTVMHGLTVGW